MPRRDDVRGAHAITMAITTVLGGMAACHRTTVDAPAASEAGADATTVPEAGVMPVSGEWMQKLELPDKGYAYVCPPLGATGRRPIVVAMHGAGDNPGFMCSAWRSITDGYPFVVAPAGTPVGGGMHSWGSADQLQKRALEAIDVVEKRWPEHVEIGAPVVYTAFSQGATTAGPLLVKHGERFPRVVLTEGGHHVFEDAQVARSFARAGGERVLFSCSTGGCVGGFKASVATLTKANVRAQIDDAGPLGHSIPPQAREGLNRQLPFLVEGLRGWEGYASHEKQSVH
jgi:predicted esterase